MCGLVTVHKSRTSEYIHLLRCGLFTVHKSRTSEYIHLLRCGLFTVHKSRTSEDFYFLRNLERYSKTFEITNNLNLYLENKKNDISNNIQYTALDKYYLVSPQVRDRY